MKATPVLFVAALAATGCLRAPLGPKTIPPARLNYNEAISRSWDEQLLLNLVRLRYRDNPLFVDVTSVSASYELNRNASVGFRSTGRDLDLTEMSGGLGMAFNEKPIVTYNYLRGEEFAQRLLSPVAPITIAALGQAGWSVERLLLCCVQSVNGVANAVAAAGPTPDYVPEYEAFHRLAGIARRLQLANALHVDLDDKNSPVLIVSPTAGPDADELRRMLSVDKSPEYRLVAGRHRREPSEIAIQGRSLLAVMYFLSQAVEVPAADIDAGKVTRTRSPDGGVFEWSRVVGPLLRIASGPEAPAESAVRVAFRGHWFWIEDSDLNSKTTFGLLRLLLFLKSGDTKEPSPLITISR